MSCAPPALHASSGYSTGCREWTQRAAKSTASKLTQSSFPLKCPYPKPPTRPAPPSIRNGQFLGRGASKSVIAKVRDGGIIAVMTSETHDLEKEAAVMTSISAHPHPHILPLLATENTPLARVSLLVPVALFGSMCDLADHLEFESMALSLADVSVATLQVADAMLHLANLGIDHGDVYARNVLVMHYDSEYAMHMHVCLGDFGEARVLKERAVLDAALPSLVRELYALVGIGPFSEKHLQ